MPVRPKRPRARSTTLNAAGEALPARHVRGREAEEAAAQWLVDRGFTILWTNVRIGALELDLVAKKDDLVVIVEVRTRGPGSFEGPLASIGREKRRALLSASRGLWRGRLKKMTDVKRVRIDVAAVTLGDEEGSAGTSLPGRAASVEWIAGAITENDV